MGSICRVEYRRFALAPSDEKGSYPGSPSSGHDCHPPCWMQTVHGPTRSVNLAVTLILPSGVSRDTHSPSKIPNSLAVSGCISTKGWGTIFLNEEIDRCCP